MSLFLKSDLYDILCKIYSEERILGNIEKLYQLEKPRGYSAFRDSTAWCEEVLRKEGFSDVRRIPHKADGVTSSYDFIMPQAWDLCGRSTLEIVEPVSEIIADTDISTLFVSEYSAPTPESGITAEIVDYSTLDPENPDCDGKFVFYRGYHPVASNFHKSLANAGCAGIVFAAFETTEHEPDVPTWTNGHGHIGWYHLKEDAVLPVFSVSPKKGIELIKMMAKGKVVLHGVMNTKIYDGEIYSLTATIPGKSEDEFALLGHLYEPFRSDDSQGFGVGVEIAIMLKKLIDDGILPKPKKTLRIIFSMERYGFAAFFAQHNKKILAALSIDTLTVQSADTLNMGFSVTLSPLSLPFFGDMLIKKAMDTLCPEIYYRFRPGSLSDDCWMGESSVDIPTNWLVSGCAGRSDYHHCDAPIFDAIQPEKLKKLVPMAAAYTAVMICGDRNHFGKMADELGKIAAYWLETEKNFIAGKAAKFGWKKTDVLSKVKAFETYYLGRMESFNRFFPGIVKPELPAHWADDYFSSLPDRELSDAEKKAASIYYRKASTGVPFSQVRVPAQERECQPMAYELTWALLAPGRSMLDVIRMFDAILSYNTPDKEIEAHLEYFSFLEKYGYVEEVKQSRKGNIK